MAKTYHCYKCGRAVTATTISEVLKKVQSHDIQKHNIRGHSSMQVREIRRKIESYMEN